VTGARLWADGSAPDFNSTNDVWGTPPAASTAASTAGGLSGDIGGKPLP
jgi:hypothetical protein